MVPSRSLRRNFMARRRFANSEAGGYADWAQAEVCCSRHLLQTRLNSGRRRTIESYLYSRHRSMLARLGDAALPGAGIWSLIVPVGSVGATDSELQRGRRHVLLR